MRNITSGLRSLFRREQVDRDLDEELRAYQEMAAEVKMKGGMSRQDALRAVRLERGNLDGTKEIVYSGGLESVVDALWRDLLFAFRMLRPPISRPESSILRRHTHIACEKNHRELGNVWDQSATTDAPTPELFLRRPAMNSAATSS